MNDVVRLALLVVVDVVWIVSISIGVGAWAPRWRGSWLDHDPVPLARLPWESPAWFRRLRARALARRLPELGSTFGGQSKDALPGHTPDELRRYVREVRRAEWVHWISIGSTLVLFTFNPWWLALVFVVGVSIGNLPFLIVLRNNRFRILRILDKDGAR